MATKRSAKLSNRPIAAPALEAVAGGFDDWGGGYDFGGNDFGGNDDGYGSGGSFGNDPGGSYGYGSSYDDYTTDPWGGSYTDVGGSHGDPFAYDGNFDYDDWWGTSSNDVGQNGPTVESFTPAPVPEVWTAPDPVIGDPFPNGAPGPSTGAFEIPTIDHGDPPYPSDLPHIDPSGAGDGPSASDIQANNVSLFNVVDDPSNPPFISQGRDVGDCTVVASLNSIASQPGGHEYLDSLVHDLGNGFYDVTLTDRSGNPYTVTVGLPIDAANGDSTMMVLESALGATRTADLYEGGNVDAISRGGEAIETMQALGLQNLQDTTASGAVSEYIAHGGVGGAPGGYTIDTKPPAIATTEMQQAYAHYGLVANHAYQISGTFTDAASGETMVVLQNPWGGQNPAPIPQSSLDQLFWNGAVGTVPSRGVPSGSDTSGGG